MGAETVHDKGSVDEVVEKVRTVLAKMLHVDTEAIRADSKLQDELGIDSFYAVELLFELEDQYQIEIPDDDAKAFRTVQDVADDIFRRLSGS